MFSGIVEASRWRRWLYQQWQCASGWSTHVEPRETALHHWTWNSQTRSAVLFQAIIDYSSFEVFFCFGRATYWSMTCAVSESVHLSVCHTRDSHVNGSRYWSTVYTIRLRHVSSFLRPNFAILKLGPPTSASKTGTPLSTVKIGPIIRSISETVQGTR